MPGIIAGVLPGIRELRNEAGDGLTKLPVRVRGGSGGGAISGMRPREPRGGEGEQTCGEGKEGYLNPT
jgi:hypothetical protein